MIRAGIRRAFRLSLTGKRGWERDVEDEIKLHLSLRAEQLMAGGAQSDDAYREAVRRFGPLDESRGRLIEAARHREQRMQRTEYIADLKQDLAFALRTLRRQKGWTAVTVLTLALGVGATTAVFSVVSSLLLHTLPYPGGNRVVYVYQQPNQGNSTGIMVTINPSSPSVRAWKTGSHSFEALEGFSSTQMDMRTTGNPASLNVGRIEPTFPNFAGKRPLIGRMFGLADITAGGRVALLGEEMWRSRFGADSAVVGKAITLDDSLYTIIGVLPASLQSPTVGDPPRDVWLPLDLRDDKRGMMVVARLLPGADVGRAARELDSLYAHSAGFTSGKIPFQAVVVSPAARLAFRDSLVMLAFAVALVLLIACANVAHLLMARSASRQRELAIRAALGAGRGRVFRQLLTESLLLATSGTAIGVLVGWLGLKALIALRPPALSTLSVAHLDTTTLALAATVAVVTGVVFGLMGAVQSRHHSTNDSLKSSGGRTSGGGRGRARTFLIISEMALSATLVVGATMLVRSVVNLQRAELGFEAKGLYTLRVTGGTDRNSSPVARGALLRTLATRLATVPGIRSVAMASTPPSWRSFSVGRLEIEGEAAPPATTTSFIDVNRIGTGYFPTMGIRLVYGTPFTDTVATANQVIVNAGFARKHWTGASAIGRRLRVAQKSGAESWLTIVGVAADAATSGPMSESSAPLLYTAAADSNVVAVLLRTDGSADLLTPVQALVRSIDPRLTVKLDDADRQISQSIATPRFVMLLLTVFTILALMLAAIGLYGVMAYTVSEQTREIGIRVALGATRARIARRVLASGIVVAILGAAVGLATAAWGTKLIESQLYGVARSDFVSFFAATVVLLCAAIVACIVPTRRALAVDPMTAIRAD